MDGEAHLRRWCCSLVPPVWKKSQRTRRPAPRMMLGAAAIQLLGGSTPLIYQGQKTAKWRACLPNFFQIFSHVLQAAQDALADRTLVHALDLRNGPKAHALDDTGIHTAALDIRQTV